MRLAARGDLSLEEGELAELHHLTLDGQKISKSLGNTVYVEDLETKNISPLAYKYWLYTSHYSTLSNFTWEAVEATQKALQKIYAFLESQNEIGKASEGYKEKFKAFMNDNLDTPKAVALVWELMKDTFVTPADKKATLLDFDTVLKLGFKEVVPQIVKEVPAEITELAERRNQARLDNDFALADSLREKIEQLGYIVKDTDSGFTRAPAPKR